MAVIAITLAAAAGLARRCPLAASDRGSALAAAGAAFLVWASHTLGNALTPFLRPRPGASLVERGPYRLARHPIYGGGLLVFGGVSLARSVPSLVLTVLLAALWWRKSLAEEERLEHAYPEYPAYRERTPHRFLPYVL